MQEASFEEKRLMELKDKLRREAEEREQKRLLKIKNAHKEIYVSAKLGNLQAVREGFANGGDQFKGAIPEDKICSELGIKVIDGLGDKIQSSSWLLKKI